MQVEELWPCSRSQQIFDRRAVPDQQMLMPGRVNDSKRERYTYMDRVSIDDHLHSGSARKQIGTIYVAGGETRGSGEYILYTNLIR